MSASAVRVVIRGSLGERDQTSQARGAMRRRSRIYLLVVGPVLLLALVARVSVLIRDAKSDLALTVGASIFTLVLIAALTAVFLKRQEARASRFPGQLWYSRAAFFAGPFEDAGGLPGSAEFDRRHRGKASSAVVRLVLTDAEMAIVPAQGPNDPYRIPLHDLRTVELVRGDRRSRGVTITTVDGASATFLVAPDPVLADRLASLGATVERSKL